MDTYADDGAPVSYTSPPQLGPDQAPPRTSGLTPYQLASRMLGSNENRQHEALTEYLRNGGSHLDPATQAWCAAFVNSSLEQAGIHGTGSDLARSFMHWGQPTNNPRVGDIAVFSRGDPNGPYGHVGFYGGRDAQGNIRLLAGNQGDAVSMGVVPASRLLGFRSVPTDAQGTQVLGYADDSSPTAAAPAVQAVQRVAQAAPPAKSGGLWGSYQEYTGAPAAAPAAPAAPAQAQTAPADSIWGSYPEYQGDAPSYVVPPQEAVGYVKDFFKSLPSVAAKGAAIVGGMYGDAQQGAKWLEDKVKGSAATPDYSLSQVNSPYINETNRSVGRGAMTTPQAPEPPAEFANDQSPAPKQDEHSWVPTWLQKRIDDPRNDPHQYAERYGGRSDQGASFPMPTSDQIVHGIEKVTGPLYEPQHTSIKIATKPVEFLPGLMLDPEATVPRALKEIVPSAVAAGKNFVTRAAIPGALSEGAGQASDKWTPGLSPIVRPAVALAAGAATSRVDAPSTAERALAHRLPPWFTEQNLDKAEQIMLYAESKGLPMVWPEAMSQAVGRPVLTDELRYLESNHYSKQIIEDRFGNRAERFKAAAKGDGTTPGVFDETLGPKAPNFNMVGPQVSDAAKETIKGVNRWINEATRSDYKAAEPVLIPPQAHQAMMQRPEFVDALREVRANPYENSYTVGKPDNSVAVYDAIKQHLEMGERNDASKINPKQNEKVAAAKGALAGEVRDMAIAADNVGQHGVGSAASGTGTYGPALEKGQRLRNDFLDPVLNGPLKGIADAPKTKDAINALFEQNPGEGTDVQVRLTMGALAKENPMAAAQLVRAHAGMVLNDAFRKTQGMPGGNQFGAAAFNKIIAGNDQQALNLRAAVEAAYPDGAQRWEGFQKLLEVAQAQGYRMPIGSRTEFNRLFTESMEEHGRVAEVGKVIASPGKWTHIVGDMANKWQLGRNTREMANILADPRNGPLFRKLIALKANSDQAGAIVARLITQANSASGPSKPSDEVNQPRQ